MKLFNFFNWKGDVMKKICLLLILASLATPAFGKDMKIQPKANKKITNSSGDKVENLQEQLANKKMEYYKAKDEYQDQKYKILEKLKNNPDLKEIQVKINETKQEYGDRISKLRDEMFKKAKTKGLKQELAKEKKESKDNEAKLTKELNKLKKSKEFAIQQRSKAKRQLDRFGGNNSSKANDNVKRTIEDLKKIDTRINDLNKKIEAKTVENFKLKFDYKKEKGGILNKIEQDKDIKKITSDIEKLRRERKAKIRVLRNKLDAKTKVLKKELVLLKVAHVRKLAKIQREMRDISKKLLFLKQTQRNW